LYRYLTIDPHINGGLTMEKKLSYKDGESDVLIIGYDQGDKDKPCIVVCRKRRGGLNCVNAIYGTEAAEIYKKLVTPTLPTPDITELIRGA
jgi:hypothetical protein